MKRGLVSEVRCDEGPAPEDSERGRGAEVEVESAEARAARLRSLRDAIASGDYQIGAEAVASKVMERMRMQGKATGDASDSGGAESSRPAVRRAGAAVRRTADPSES